MVKAAKKLSQSDLLELIQMRANSSSSSSSSSTSAAAGGNSFSSSSKESCSLQAKRKRKDP